MISALTFIVAGIVILIGPIRRPRTGRDIQEGIWVARSSKKETAQAA